MSADPDSSTPSDSNGAFQSHESHEGREYLESRKSRELPGSPKCHESPVSPVSNGQGLEGELEGLAAHNVCTECNTADDKRWQLARDVKAVQVRLGRQLDINELALICSEWFSCSQICLEQGETFEDHLAAFLAELGKVRYPTGDGATLSRALENVSKLSFSELPEILGIPGAPENWRRILALHRELSQLSARKNKTYFLSYRDAAKVLSDLDHQKAYRITLALGVPQIGAIKIVSKGKAGSEGGKPRSFAISCCNTGIKGRQTAGG